MHTNVMFLIANVFKRGFLLIFMKCAESRVAFRIFNLCSVCSLITVYKHRFKLVIHLAEILDFPNITQSYL